MSKPSVKQPVLLDIETVPIPSAGKEPGAFTKVFDSWWEAQNIQHEVLKAFTNDSLAKPWSWEPGIETGRWTKNPSAKLPMKPAIPYPGLTDRRRVVLDLAFSGYRMSGEVVSKNGDLLGIAAPGAKFDAVPGAIVATMHLGEALQKLQQAHAKFDLIVCELPGGSTTPQVGTFAPPPSPLAKAGRRLILPGRATEKVLVPGMPLCVAVWRATQALLSEHGEALIGMEASDYNELHKRGESGFERVWYLHRKNGAYFHAYLHRTGSRGCARSLDRAPDYSVRMGSFHSYNVVARHSEGQRNTFETALATENP